jgi:type II secretory ATPase GspE/PulE/Tfp pilus assembly ATPase PilB-like protein
MDDKQKLTILVSKKYISEEDRDEALKVSDDSYTEAINYLIHEKKIVTEDIIGQAIAEYFNVRYYDLNTYFPNKQQAMAIPEEVARAYRVVLFRENADSVMISTDRILNLVNYDFDSTGGTAKEILESQIKSEQPAETDEKKGGLFGGGKKKKDEEYKNYITKEVVENVLKGIFGKKVEFGYSLTKDIEKVFGAYKRSLSARFIDIINQSSEIAPEIVDEIARESIEARVSDIHFEPQSRKEARVRFRIDGVLQNVGEIPMTFYQNVLNLVKVRAQLRTDEHFAPQDGSIRFKFEDEEPTDVRVSIVPAIYGEKIVMRVLSNTIKNIDLPSLGFTSKNLKAIRRASKLPFGMILVTGPTGSGKSTTLFAVLKTLNDEGKNITTIEDPVEYRIPGVNHIQVNENLTFASGLRAGMRQDPDIILVGEIRDNETASIAINAALTGHLLLSTIHANDSESTIPRLLNMDVDHFLVASTLEVIVAQRLVRRICTSCVYTYTMSEDEIRDMINYDSEIFKGKAITLYRGKGCGNCNNTGYKGRLGIYEILEMNSDLKEAITRSATAEEIREIAAKHGATTMFDDGLEKAKLGMTTIEEILRVATPPNQRNL